MKSKDKWERVKIWQSVTKGPQAPHGPYNNWERSDGTKTGGYIDYYDWHFEGYEQQAGVNISDDIRSYITVSTEDIMTENQEETTDKDTLSLVLFLQSEEQKSPDAMKAKQFELQHFKKYGVYREVDDIWQPRVSSVGFEVDSTKPELI